MSSPSHEIDDHRVIRQVIRGERPLEDLLTAGLNTTLQVNQRGWYALHNPNPNRLDVAVDVRDVAAGFLHYSKHQPEQLRPWAFTIYAGGFWHSIGGHPDDSAALHQLVIDALWAVNFTDPIPIETVKLFERLAGAPVRSRSRAATAGTDEDTR